MKKPFLNVVVLCLLSPAVAAMAQTVAHSFDGDTGPGETVCKTGVTHCAWPDMNAGVNGKQVVEVTWQNVRVYDYSGHLQRSTPMTTFIRNAGLNPIPPQHRKPTGPSVPGPYEPSVVFNEFIQRWIVTVTGFSDSLLVSASADALGSWGGVNLSCLQGGPCLDNDPALHIGYDKNGVYYCGGHPGEGNPNTIPGVSYDCFAVPTAEVAAISRGTAPSHINRGHSLPLDIFPAVDHTRNKAPGAPAFFATKTCDRSVIGGCQNASNFSFDWLVDSFTWNGSTGTWSEQLVKTAVGSMENLWLYNKPCCGQLGIISQAGNDAVALRGVESHRLSNLVQAGSHVHGVMTSGPCTHDCGQQGTDTNNLAFWVDLDCSKPAACVVSQTAKVSGVDANPAFATVGVDHAGNVGIVAASWSPTTNLSLLLWAHRKSDPVNTMNGPTTIVKGTQPFTCINDKGFANVANPAGVLTALDPVDGATLWTAHHYSNDATACVWNTRIVGYQIAPGGKSKPPKLTRQK